MIAIAENLVQEEIVIQKCTTPMCDSVAVPYWVEEQDGTAVFLNTDMCCSCVESMLGRR